MLARPTTNFREMTQGEGHRWWALAAVECGNFVVYMDGFIVTLALPTMARHFGVGLAVLKWVIVSYLLTVTVTLLPAGRLADIWGRKRVVVVGMVVLVVSAVLCMLAPTVETLIAFRILQGIGGGLVLANVMAEITAVFPKEERRRAMAVNASILAMAQIAGLVLGGAVIGQFGWRSLFAIMLAISVPGLILSQLVLRPPTATTTERASFDWMGALLAIGAVGTPFLLVEHLSAALDTTNLLLLAGGAVVLVLFVLVERRKPTPLLDLSLLKSRGFTCGSASAAFYFVAAVSCYFLIPLYAQVVLGLSPTKAGLVMIPIALVLTATSLGVGPFVAKLSARTLGTAAMLFVSGGVFGLSRLGSDASILSIVVPLALIGFGGGLFHPPNNSATLGSVPRENLGAGNGFLSTARNFGQAIGAALAATLLAHGIGPDAAALSQPVGEKLGGSTLESYMAAQQFALKLAAALGLVGAVISALRGADMPVATVPGKGSVGVR